MFRTTFVTLAVLGTVFAGVLAASPAQAWFCTTPGSPVDLCGNVDLLPPCAYVEGDVNADTCPAGVCVGSYQAVGATCGVQTEPVVGLHRCGSANSWAVFALGAGVVCVYHLPLP